MSLVFITVKDFGEIQNKILGRRYYKPGEIVQAHIRIDDYHLWIEHNRAHEDTPFRVAVGMVPGYSPLVSLDDARREIGAFLDILAKDALVDTVRAVGQFLGEVSSDDILDA